MPRRISTLALVAAVALSPNAVIELRAQSPEQPALRILIVELKKLRLEVIEQRLESQQENTRRLERELQQIRRDELQLEEEERARAHALKQTDQQLAQSELTAEERQELEANRATFISGGLQDSGKSSLDQRRNEVTQELNQARRDRQQLLERARLLGIEIGEVRQEKENNPRASRPPARE